MTRTAAHATDFVRIRPGTDIPILYGMLWHIFKNGWEDKEFIKQRVYGMDEVRAEVEKWTPDEVERVTGVPEAQLKRVAETFAKQKPSCLIWAMGQTQHTVGTANVRASCILLMATGNVGNIGNGANPFRGHDNVQGASDMGLDITTLPLYYGLTDGAWQHWCRVWEIDFDWMRRVSKSKPMMGTSGIPATRWFDAAMLPKDQVQQKDNVKAMMVFGHSPNTFTRLPEAAQGLERLDLLVVCDPHPTNWAVLGERKNGTYLLPICTQYESAGHAYDVQWLAAIVRADRQASVRDQGMTATSSTCWPKSSVFADGMFKNIKVENDDPLAEDVLREINRGGWSTGYTGQSPERLKAHLRNQHKFDPVTLRAPKDDPEVGGDYYGLPWPCWGKPELRHPGTPMLYNTNLHVMDGGGTFRARFGVEREVTLARRHHAQRQSPGRRLVSGRLGNHRTGIRSSPTRYSRSSAGTRTSSRKSLPSSSASAATTPIASPGRRISPAAFSGWHWRMVAVRSATRRHAPLLGTCPTRSRCTASRSTRFGPELVAKYPTRPNEHAVPGAECRLRCARRQP